MVCVFKDYSKSEFRVVVRFIEAQGMSSECLLPERFQPKGSVFMV
jgi:hypothetical protein